MIALLAELLVVLLEKGVPALQTALLKTSEMSAAEKAATIARLGAALRTRAAEVDAVVVLDPDDPANLP